MCLPPSLSSPYFSPNILLSAPVASFSGSILSNGYLSWLHGILFSCISQSKVTSLKEPLGLYQALGLNQLYFLLMLVSPCQSPHLFSACQFILFSVMPHPQIRLHEDFSGFVWIGDFSGEEGGGWEWMGDGHWGLLCMLVNWTPIKNKLKKIGDFWCYYYLSFSTRMLCLAFALIGFLWCLLLTVAAVQAARAHCWLILNSLALEEPLYL